MSRFPAAFRLPAFASRSSDSRRGVGPSLRSAYRTRPLARTPTGLPRFTRTSCDRGGCLLYPEDGDARPADSSSPAGACRFPAASPCHPAACSHRGGPQLRGINGGSRDSPARPAPRLWPPDGTGTLGLSPVLRTPPLPATHDRAGPGVSTHPELRCRHNRPSNPRVPSQGATSCRNGMCGRSWYSVTV